MLHFLKGRIKAFGYASKGALILIKNEASIQVQLIIAIGVVLCGFYFDISKLEWIAQLLAIALVLSIEGLNTAIEEIADFIHPDYHNKIGRIKDVAAGAVFFSAVIAIIIACIIYIPKLLLI